MSKMRVYEYAKSQQMNSKEVIEILRRLDKPVRNHMSVIDEQMMNSIEEYMQKLKENANKKYAEDQAAQQKSAQNKSAQSKSAQSKSAQSRPSQAASKQNRPQQQISDQTAQSRRKQRDETGNERGTARREQSKGREQATGQEQSRTTNRQNEQSKRTEKPQAQDEKRSAQSPKADRSQAVGKKTSSKHSSSKQADSHDQRQTGRKQASKKGTEQHNQSQSQNKKTHVKKQAQRKSQDQPVPVKPKVEEITISGPLTVGELAKKLHRDPSELIKKLMLLGTMATINEELDVDVIHVLADEYDVTVEVKIEVDETQFELHEEEEDLAALVERPPVVTVMGHVDHGKTTLLDAIRKSNVTAREAGGITQHIGAYQIEYQNKKITFLDTPGHEAFTTMRARGAKVTDIAIIVVAADDGVMPQTKEAINHAKAAEVPMIVAVNKMDKPHINPDKVKQELSELNLVPEEWGGDTIFVPVSALNNEGLDDLMEMVLLVAEVEEFKANPDSFARGTVIEAELDQGKGCIATVLVQSGTLHVGDPIVVGSTFGRVRAMSNDLGRRIKKAGPSTPVEITGLHEVPSAGDQFKVFKDERKARAIGTARANKQKESDREAAGTVSLDELFEQIQQGGVKELNLILKADVHGSAEALKDALEKIDVGAVNVKIIHSGVGAITDSDISLATASNAIVIGFNVRPQPQAKVTADREGVDIRLHRVIYDVTEEIENALKGMLDPEYEEKVIGQVEVRQIFKVTKVGTIAGSYVKEGYITRDSSIRLLRDNVVIYEGKVDMLKRFKDDVREVQAGYECGITIENYNDIKEGDIFEAYIMAEIPR